MGIKYLWDTNIIIYYLQRQFPPLAEKFVDDLLQEESPTISAITEIEFTRNAEDFKNISGLNTVNPWRQ